MRYYARVTFDQPLMLTKAHSLCNLLQIDIDKHCLMVGLRSLPGGHAMHAGSRHGL